MTYASIRDVTDMNPKFLPKDKSDPDKEVSFVPMAQISDQYGRIEKELSRPLSEVLKGFTPFQDRDVLVAKITPCFENGKIAHARINREWGFGSTEFHVLRSNRELIDDRYLYHFMRTPLVRVAGKRRMTGSAGQKRVPKAFLESLQIPLPPLPEQKRIAAILDQADALREKRRMAIAKLDELLQSVFMDMFGDPVTNPKGWAVSPLSDLLLSIDSGWSPKCEERPARTNEWGVLKLGSATWCDFNSSENKALPSSVKPRPELEVRLGSPIH